jgi:hypothetical protein
VPYFLFADALKPSVRDEITRREGQEFVPVDEDAAGGRRPRRATTRSGRTPAGVEAPAVAVEGKADAAPRPPRPIG